MAAFAINLGALFAAVGAARPVGGLAQRGPDHDTLLVSGSQMADAQPVDLLWLHVALGAVEALAGLSAAQRATWLATAKLDVLGGVRSRTSRPGTTPTTRPPPQSRPGRSSRSATTLSCSPARRARCCAPRSAYAAITTQLAAALDDSFARDPIFGNAASEPALALSSRGRTLSRTPAFPRFPIALGDGPGRARGAGRFRATACRRRARARTPQCKRSTSLHSARPRSPR